MDPLASLRSLAESWHQEADVLRKRGASGPAEALDSAADELEEQLREWSLELLTLEEAAREAGVSYDTMQRKVGRQIPNAGEKGSPRVRRCDLHPWLREPEGNLSVAEQALLGRQERG